MGHALTFNAIRVAAWLLSPHKMAWMLPSTFCMHLEWNHYCCRSFNQLGNDPAPWLVYIPQSFLVGGAFLVSKLGRQICVMVITVCLLSVEIERQIEKIQAQRKKLEPMPAPGDKVWPPTCVCVLQYKTSIVVWLLVWIEVPDLLVIDQ